jgi:hypothetical protein
MPRAADLDIGDINPYRGKQAEMLTPVGKQSRDLDRAGLRDLDRRTENLPRMARHQRDVNRTMPRDGTGPAVLARRLPADTHPRRLTVYRQRILNKQKTALDGDRVPVRAKRAFNKVFTSNDELTAINDQLSANVGDITELDDATRLTVQRVDRIIQLAESHNTADNIVYTPIQVPAGVNSGNVRGWLQNSFAGDTEVNFDRYTVTSHEMSQATEHHPEWRPVCEIVTRRGAYVGKAPKTNDTNSNADHLLPRGMQLRCVGIKTVPVASRDGTVHSRLVLQLEDLR